MEDSIYQAIFGIIELDIKDLEIPHLGIVITQKSIDFLTKDIRENGLINPIDVLWDLRNDNSKLIAERGNQRIEVLKRLGWKKVPCYLKIRFYESNIDLLNNFKKIFHLVAENKGLDCRFFVEQKQTNYTKFK